MEKHSKEYFQQVSAAHTIRPKPKIYGLQLKWSEKRFTTKTSSYILSLKSCDRRLRMGHDRFTCSAVFTFCSPKSTPVTVANFLQDYPTDQKVRVEAWSASTPIKGKDFQNPAVYSRLYQGLWSYCLSILRQRRSH